MRVAASYKGFIGAISRYWRDYGGWRDFLASPLLHLSVLITAGSYRVWLNGTWVDIPLALLPNLLGFSLGSYALIFSLANEKFTAALSVASTDNRPTLLRMINATFLHFMLMQTAALIFAISQKGSAIIDLVGMLPIRRDIINLIQAILAGAAGAFGYWLTVYAIVLLIGAAIAAYRLAIMSAKAASPSPENGSPPAGGPIQ